MGPQPRCRRPGLPPDGGLRHRRQPRVGKGVFYWYFSSKEELLSEILRDAHLQLRRCQQAALADEPDRYAGSSSASSRHWSGSATIASTSRSRSSPRPTRPSRRCCGATARSRSPTTVRHLKEAIVEGRVADGEPELLAHAILGVVDQLTAPLSHRARRARRADRRGRDRVLQPRSRGRTGDLAAHPSFVRPLRRPRTAWVMRCSFSTSAKRTNPSPPGPKPLPGDTATFGLLHEKRRELLARHLGVGGSGMEPTRTSCPSGARSTSRMRSSPVEERRPRRPR